MSVAVRPHTKLAAALFAAGVVATAPGVVAGPAGAPVLSDIAVRPASFVTDALYAAGDVVSAMADTVMIGTDLALGLNYYWDDSDFGLGVPTNPVFFAAAALQNPGSALSWLAQTYLNPSNNYANYAYPWYFKSAVIEPVVGVLPAQLASAVTDAINGVANGINDALSNLPDPTPTVDSLGAQYDTTVGRAVYAVQNAIALPVTLLTAVTYYLAYLPANVEATVESAIQYPADLPGLVSNLVWGALDPTLYNGLLGDLSYNLLKPSFFLPAPIGDSSVGAHDGLAYAAYKGFADAVTSVLNLLPAPITPTPFPAAAAASGAPAAAVASGASAAASAAAVNDDATAPEKSSMDATDVTASDGQTTESPKATAKVRPSRKAATPNRTSAKSSTDGKSDGGATGGQGRSARAGKAGSAA